MDLANPVWAWAPYQPNDARPWTLQLAGHLYRRAAFGGNWGQLRRAVADGPQRAVDALLKPDADVEAFNRAHDKNEASSGGSNATDALRAWWLRRMIETPHPLLEKMTLFWHGYFAISNAKVNSALLMGRHVQQLRRHALGSFATMLETVCNDPAVFLHLEAKANRKARPSEFFPRVFLEQFTVGTSNFTEKDVREVARAFTGWFVFGDELREIEREHDSGVKHILGQKGALKKQDVVRIALQQPATAQRVLRQLYRWLISEEGEPSDALIAPLAVRFAKDHNIGAIVETMLRSNLFFSPAAYRRRVKSPVEFALGIVRGLEGNVGTPKLAGDLAALGQELYNPPTVKGWAGGRCWINRLTMLARARLAHALASGAEPYQLDPLDTAKRHGRSTVAEASQFLLDLFLQGDVSDSFRDMVSPAGSQDPPTERMRRFVALVAAQPEFQLA
ncbi:MAG: DUF1800 domain-containing protein [Verrucomicrobiae bacterium]|nr:DUF1800 domain-containing protein [Verrucomicrobiae bacterium]